MSKPYLPLLGLLILALVVGEGRGIRFIASQLEPKYRIEKEEEFLIVLSQRASN